MVIYCSSKGKKVCNIFEDKPMIVNEKDLEPNIQIFMKKKDIKKKIYVKDAETAAEVLRNMAELDRENVHVLHLNTKNQVVGIEKISTGTLNQTLIHPRELFKGAILNNANAVIVAHNHPSGNPELSNADREVGLTLKDAGEIMGIHVLDFISVTKDSYKSVEAGD